MIYQSKVIKTYQKTSFLYTYKFIVSDRHGFNYTGSQQPIPTHSPKIQTSQASITPKYQSNRVDQTFSNEHNNSPPRAMRKAYTWTRPANQQSNRDIISPIQIPTFSESSCGPSYDRVPITHNQNYDDDDEFERYSPTPPSTPKNILPNIKQNFILNEQQTMIRPITYQKAKRSEKQQKNESKF